MSRAPSVAEAIRDRLAALTASERRAARALLANYPMLGLETVAEFSARSGVSSPTVLRFTTRLGFANYAEFQRRLREEVEAQLKSPLAKALPSEARVTPGIIWKTCRMSAVLPGAVYTSIRVRLACGRVSSIA